MSVSSPFNVLSNPKPAKKYIAELATRLSIQPGVGSLQEAPIIEGLTIVKGKLLVLV